ncbi:MAG: serine/threonine protein kinase [Gemmatimonadaceae bacterium]|nr:serine/threonine protein kinase [Gemmatimonadaceae bacterium]MCW5826199.1 serine/threonine protein kinase [Gemmatimonadaceae bacterium]
MTDATPDIPERIGPYRILGLLGEGGMGVVYEADETGPVKRRVALKVIRAGFATREVIARFDAERQALAMMDHAGIAKVLHAGETEQGLPYVVMELVRGLPLTTYCDAHRLPLNARIDLFIQVCLAVQHAHQKGVIHRDLKPSNILVVEEDGQPRPKIIDFGIAKAVGRRLTENTLITHAGVALGTAAYMSPEQAEGAGLDVDTRSDIYALGVILFELLVGKLPMEPEVMGYHAFLVRLASREWQVPLPSARLRSLEYERNTIAHLRRTDVERLARELQGDLDWIVLRALEPERARRYPTANALMLDLQRARADEPVGARPPSARYRVRKFVRRHRVGVATAALVITALTVSAVLATVGLVRATRAEQVAATEAAAAQSVTDFVVGLFAEFDPEQLGGAAPARDVTARELLARGATRARAELARQPEQRGRILQTIGSAYLTLGLFPEAIEQLQAAREAREAILAPGASELADTYYALGQATRALGQFAAADSHFVRALAVRERDHGANSLEAARVLGALALVKWRQGRLVEAESLFLRVVRIDDALLDPDDRRLARDLMGLGIVYWAQGRLAEAEPMLRRSLEVREATLGPDHPELASVLSNLGTLYFSLGRYPDALRHYERTLGIYERTLDAEHPNMALILNNIGETQWKLGRLDLAEPLLRRALAIKEKRLAAGNPSIAVTLHALGGVLEGRGDHRAAEAAYRRALAIRRAALPAGDANIVESTKALAGLLRRTGRATEATELERQI